VSDFFGRQRPIEELLRAKHSMNADVRDALEEGDARLNATSGSNPMVADLPLDPLPDYAPIMAEEELLAVDDGRTSRAGWPYAPWEVIL
jgi:hypothetical protein